jgi:N6-L-threonylcarbamoyladenine synthase
LLEDPAPRFPFLSLVVSGGHTALYVCRGLGRHELWSQTLDDAAGEAFDKVARLLGLGFPGGPAVDRLAALGDPTKVPLPRPLAGRKDWSFAGLKTAVRTRWLADPRPEPADLCAAFQGAVVDLLLDRVRQALRETGIDQVVFSGGVAANAELRRRAVAELEGARVFLPPRARCTDNGAMIANVGRLTLLAGPRDDLWVPARPAWELG